MIGWLRFLLSLTVRVVAVQYTIKVSAHYICQLEQILTRVPFLDEHLPVRLHRPD